jgi:hypothetical protein
MKSFQAFHIQPTNSNLYEVFIYWEKRYTFTNLKDATKFIVQANSLVFKEVFKLNELLIELYPDARRLLFTAKGLQKHTIVNKLKEIEALIDYCHNPTGYDKGVYIIHNCETSYCELGLFNQLIQDLYRKQGNTIAIYRTKLYAERLETSYAEFMDFKFVRLENLIKGHECRVIKLAANQ